MDKAEYYFNKFGPAKAVMLARFIPIVRTFLNPVAGVLGMPARQFFICNVIGAVLWTDGILLDRLLARRADHRGIGREHRQVHPAGRSSLIVLISVMPIFIEIFRGRRAAPQRRPLPPGRDDPPRPAATAPR